VIKIVIPTASKKGKGFGSGLFGSKSDSTSGIKADILHLRKKKKTTSTGFSAYPFYWAMSSSSMN